VTSTGTREAGRPRPILPREHGAWAVLYGSFLAGLGVAGRAGLPVALLVIGVTAAALASGPLGLLASPSVGATRRRQARQWLAVWGGLAAAALLPLLVVFRLTFLLPFGVAGAGLFALRGLLVRRRADRTLGAELLGAVGLTLVGPVTHAVAVGRLEPMALRLWLPLTLFFASGVFYIRMRIQEMLARRAGRASSPALRPCLAYHALLLVVAPVLAAAGLVPWATVPAFLPALARAAAGARARGAAVDVRRLGWLETGVTVAFVALLMGGFRLAHLTG